MTDKKTEEKNPTILLLFVGRCILKDNSEGRVYYQLDEDDFKAGVMTKRDGDVIERVFSSKAAARHMSGSAGIVYRVETPKDRDTSIFPDTAEYAGMWPDQEQRAAWQMADKTKGQQIALMKRGKKAQTDDSVLECLAPIRTAYQRARGVQKSLILARAVQYITRG